MSVIQSTASVNRAGFLFSILQYIKETNIEPCDVSFCKINFQLKKIQNSLASFYKQMELKILRNQQRALISSEFATKRFCTVAQNCHGKN